MSPVDVLAIGASAGGVEALGVLLPALPRDFAASVVVVLHLPPDRESLLVELFSPRCALPVREPEDKEPLAPGTLYFAPPGYHLLVEPDKTFSLSLEPPVNFSRPSIDVCLESIAYSLGSRAMGLLLTGANDDGARGLKAIQQKGGTVWVQSPDEAQNRQMPQAALALVAPDAVLTLGQLAERLAQGLVR